MPLEPVTLFLCGDVMTGRGVDQILPFSCPPRLHEVFVESALAYVKLAEEAICIGDAPSAKSYPAP